MTSKRGWRDRGSATVWVLALATLLTVAGVVAITVAIGFVTYRRAASAADLAALAGATRSVSDEPSACLAAASVARMNGAQLVDCHLSDSSVYVLVVTDPKLRWLPTIHIAARAGFRQ